MGWMCLKYQWPDNQTKDDPTKRLLTLPHTIICKIKSKIPQIGNRFAVTAAHCLFDESKEEVLTSCFFGPVSKLKHQVTLVEFVKSLLAVRCKILYSFVRLCLPVSSPSCLASTTGEIWKSQTGSNLLSVFHDIGCQENNKGKQGHSP